MGLNIAALTSRAVPPNPYAASIPAIEAAIAPLIGADPSKGGMHAGMSAWPIPAGVNVKLHDGKTVDLASELMANNGLFTAFHEYLRTQGSSGLLLNKRGEEVVGVGIRNKISRKRKGRGLELNVKGVSVYVFSPNMDDQGNITWAYARIENGEIVSDDEIREALRKKYLSK